MKAYSSDLKEFLKAVGSDVHRDEYEELAMSWLNLTRNVVAPKTTGRRLTSLRSFGGWIGMEDVLKEYIAPTPGRQVPHPLSEGIDGIRRMIEATKNHEQAALVSLIGEVGCRISEARAVNITTIDAYEMMVTIRGKGDKTRVVPISPLAWEHIVPAYVLAHQKPGGQLVSYQDRFARQIITNLGVRAGIGRAISSHDLRATMATEMLNNGATIRTVQEILGHASTDTTQIYTGVTDNQMREAVNF